MVGDRPMATKPGSLRERVLAGLFWSASARLVGQVFTWAITIVVIRLLTPADYGLLAMASVFVNFVVLLAEAGLGMAIVQQQSMDESELRRVFGAVILIDGLLFLVQFAAAPAIAFFFGEERLISMIRAMALQFLLTIFSVIPISLMTRTLDFKRQSLIELASAACGSVVTLALAFAGWGVWAIIAGTVFGQLCKTVAINVVAPFLKWPDFSLSGLRSLMTFGGQVTAARVLWFIYSQADVFIAGKLLGKELLGFYSVAMHVASLPVQKLSAVVNQVAFPTFAQTQHDVAAVRSYLLKAVRLLSFLSFPLLWGVSSISNEIVEVLLGPGWAAAALPLQLLPLVMPFSMLTPFFNAAFQGIGRADIVLRNVTTACFLMPAAFAFGVQWELTGLALAWVIAFPLVFFINLRRMLPVVDLTVSSVLRALAPCALASGLMYLAVAGARIAFAGRFFSDLALTAALISVGVVSYGAAAALVNAKGLREVIGLVSRHAEMPA